MDRLGKNSSTDKNDNDNDGSIIRMTPRRRHRTRRKTNDSDADSNGNGNCYLHFCSLMSATSACRFFLGSAAKLFLSVCSFSSEVASR